jgi:uncharacterized membrane protein (DUF4010 family)
VAITSSILNWLVAKVFAWHVWIPLVLGILILAVALRRGGRGTPDRSLQESSPLQLCAALQMSALFQIALLVVSAVVAWWSVRALFMTFAMIGLTDLDALTVSLARDNRDIMPSVAGTLFWMAWLPSKLRIFPNGREMFPTTGQPTRMAPQNGIRERVRVACTVLIRGKAPRWARNTRTA